MNGLQRSSGCSGMLSVTSGYMVWSNQHPWMIACEGCLIVLPVFWMAYFLQVWHNGNCCGFSSWNSFTIFCGGSFGECFLFNYKKTNSKAIWCLPSCTICVFFKPTLQSSFCLPVPLFSFSFHLFLGVCVSSLFLLQSFSSTLHNVTVFWGLCSI